MNTGPLDELKQYTWVLIGCEWKCRVKGCTHKCWSEEHPDGYWCQGHRYHTPFDFRKTILDGVLLGEPDFVGTWEEAGNEWVRRLAAVQEDMERRGVHVVIGYLVQKSLAEFRADEDIWLQRKDLTVAELAKWRKKTKMWGVK